MIKKLTAFILAVLIILTLSACKSDDVSHKTGWNNPEEPSDNESTTTEEETTVTEEKTTEAVAEEVKISFSAEKALPAGSFNSEIYGKLTVYYQEGYFFIFDEYKDKQFTVFAEGYSPAKTDGEVRAIFDDMNFDGYTDFGVCYYRDALNSYYFCFIWNNSQRTFTYQLSLSNLANPDFDPVSNTITAYERLTTTTAIQKTYGYHQGVLTHISSQNVTEEPSTGGAETVDANLQLTQEEKNVVLTLNDNASSHSKWVCTIENESVVILSAECYNEETTAYEFTLSGIAPGATTVFFRYKSVLTGEYIEEIIVNAITAEDGTVTIVIP